MSISRKNLAFNSIKFFGQLVHSSFGKNRCFSSVDSRAKGRTGIEESEQRQLLNNNLIFAIKENKERGNSQGKMWSQKRILFFEFLIEDIWTSYLETDGNDPVEEISLIQERRQL